MNNEKIVAAEYIKWVSQGGCLIGSDCWDIVDNDHLKARGTEEHKRNDYLILRFCRKHHSERGQIGDEKFQAKYGINLYEEVAKSLVAWIQELGLRDRESWGRVAEMRRLQSRYVKTRSPTVMNESIKVEREIDGFLSKIGLSMLPEKPRGRVR